MNDDNQYDNYGMNYALQPQPTINTELFSSSSHNEISSLNQIANFSLLPFFAPERSKVEWEDPPPNVNKLTRNINAIVIGNYVYDIEVSAAVITKRENGIEKKVLRILGKREREVLDALIKVATDTRNFLEVNESTGVYFNLRDIHRVLNAKISIPGIKEALEALLNCPVKFRELKRVNNQASGEKYEPYSKPLKWDGSLLQQVISTEESEESWDEEQLDLDRRRGNYFAIFHPYVSKAVNDLQYTQINNTNLVSCSSSMSAYIEKRLSLMFVNANFGDPDRGGTYSISASTLLRSAGYNYDPDVSRVYDQFRPVLRALEEHTARQEKDPLNAKWNENEPYKIIKNFTVEKRVVDNGKVVDEIYRIWPTAAFVAQQKRSNGILKDLKRKKSFHLEHPELSIQTVLMLN